MYKRKHVRVSVQLFSIGAGLSCVDNHFPPGKSMGTREALLRKQLPLLQYANALLIEKADLHQKSR